VGAEDETQVRTPPLHTSPLHERHVTAGAKLAPFGGWSMPLEYAGGGVVAEHTAVREAVGLFDVSHLGKVGVVGTGALAHVNSVLTGDLDRIGPGQAQYTLLCNPDGGVVDDLIAYVTGSDEVLLVPNAANASAVVAALHVGAPDGVQVVDLHHQQAVLALQGPRADEVLAAAGVDVDLAYMAFARVLVGRTPVIVCRTGYTGERGYELVVPADGALAVWDALVAAGEPSGLRPAGLGARDTLRTEMGYPLHGQDLSPSITPLQARVGWAVGWGKPSFVGADALRAEKEAGPTRLLRGLRAEGRGIPRAGMVVRDAEGVEVGTVTSGTFSPTLRTGIALALLDAAVAPDADVTVDVRSRRETFRVVKPPFVPSHVR